MKNEILFIEERLEKIADYIDKKGKASVEEIMDEFNISRTTVRRDLIHLEKFNSIIRSRGGALKKKRFIYEQTL
ncbi:MAG: DeoR family transcriptional regulator [Actinomycetia bacterium]|nr:DeoR family transcriptional regulator [Actinomycetes bacterium]